jgi:hypothetical protein
VRGPEVFALPPVQKQGLVRVGSAAAGGVIPAHVKGRDFGEGTVGTEGET